MEIQESDSLTKSGKKKKGLDGQAMKNIRKISDFFKTPEKQVDKQKQKNLLQFFAKSGQETEEKLYDINTENVGEVIDTSVEVTTPNNSDKENNEVLDQNEISVSESKAKEPLKEKGIEKSCEEEKGSTRLNFPESEPEIKKKKKHKKKKSHEDRADVCSSDSLVLLSDSAINQPVTEDFVRLRENQEKKENKISEEVSGERVGKKPKSEKQPNETNSEKINTEIEDNKMVSCEKEQGIRKRKKHKKKKSQEGRMVDSFSDSVILLSDSSTAEPLTDNNVRAVEDEVSINGCSGLLSVTKSSLSDNTERKLINEVLGKTVTGVNVINSNNGNTNDVCSTSRLKKSKQRKTAASDEVSMKCKETVTSNCVDKGDTHKKMKKKHLKSESLKGDQKVQEDKELSVVEVTQKEKSKTEGKTCEKRNSKKSTLKGKDMLNLLKEIQSEESVDAKKRKHKRKHKHKVKETQKKDVMEIAVSEDNSDSKNDANMSEKPCQEKIKSQSREGEKNEKIGKGLCQNEGKRKNTMHQVLDDKEAAVSENQMKVKKDKLKKRNKSDKKSKRDLVGSAQENENQLSYEDFTENLDSKSAELPEKKKENNTKEMSYSDYLKLMEKADGVDDMDVSDCDNEDTHDDKEKMETGPQTSQKDVVDGMILEKKSIKTFFSIMTSTPDRMFSKKERKKTAEKTTVVTGDKSKIKSETSQDTQSEITKRKLEVHGTIDVETVDVNDEVDSDAQIVKVGIQSKITSSGKTTQATLSFGKTGLTVLKPLPKSDDEETKNVYKNSDKCDNPDINKIEKKNSATPGRGRKSRKDTVDLDVTDSSVFATPKNVRKGQGKRKMEEEEDSESAESGERRRSMRKRYKVEAFQMDADKKTPIKIKLKRCPKSSSSGEDSERSTLNIQKAKVNVKQSTAQALLEKAKRGRLKKHKVKNIKEKSNLIKKKSGRTKDKKSRNESNSSEDSVTRRSSRLEGRIMASMEEVSLENIVISSSEDEGETGKPMKKRGRPKGSKNRAQSPKKDVVGNTDGTPSKKEAVKLKTGTPSKNKTPSKKTGMKLAPMFLLGKNKPAVPSPKKVVLDPETLKQRQAFLMSGVPEELRKQTASRSMTQVDADYPPIPRTSHVLQAPADQDEQQLRMLNVWDLKPVQLPLRDFVIPSTVRPTVSCKGSLIDKNPRSSKNLHNIKDFRGHSPIPDDMVDLCLKEIASFNPTYPVNAMYKALKEMKVETEKPLPKSESMLRTDMKGILDGCTDMMVIEDEEDSSQKKKKRSLKLQKKTQQNIEETKVEEKTKPTGSSLLWTEKYCPAKTADVLGNSGALKKLKTWLTEWKHVLDREARKARKLLMKKNKGKLPSKKDDDDLWDDGSDFDLDSDDSGEDDSLCNTMLLTGPHGCGKTSSVYALALELGFKVHEVNTSSCRSGKQILSQLQEATQSHQVSSQGNHTPRKNTAMSEKPKAENKMPTAFTNLFKKAAPDTESKPEEKQAGKKRKRNTSDKEDENTKKGKKKDRRSTELKHKAVQLMIDDSNQSMAKSLNLSSTTLILFDEVDVVFEEDKGFLSAIQNFMSNTKIPIILTSADPGFSHTFDGRYEQMNLKLPSVASITTHLQTVSLVENARTDPVRLAELAQFYQSDVRRCLVALQFLLESGGGHSTSNKIIQTLEHSKNIVDTLGLEAENSQSNSLTNTCVTLNTETKFSAEVKSESSQDVNSDDDFVAIKPLKKRRRVLEDDNSNSVDSCLQVTVQKSVEVSMLQDSVEAKNYPLLHNIGLESFLNNTALSLEDSITRGLKLRSEARLQDMIYTCGCVKRILDTDLCYTNLPILLPFKTTVMNSVLAVSKDCDKGKTKMRQRIRIQSDLYDSEASNDSADVGKLEENLTEESESATTKSENMMKGNKLENLCLAKSLSCFARFYDTMSSLDVLETREKMKSGDKIQTIQGRDVKGTLVSGVENELPAFRPHCEPGLDACREYSSEIEIRTMCQLYNETDVVKNEMEKLCIEDEAFEDNFILPVRRQSDHFTLVDNSCISVPADYRRACDNTVDNLPLVSQSHLRTIHLEYLPPLREICRTEQCRQITNTKRRFHHYLNSITLPLKDRTISTLATTFV